MNACRYLKSLIVSFGALFLYSLETDAGELRFNFPVFELAMDANSRLEISVVSCVPPDKRGQIDAPPSGLVVECKLLRSHEDDAPDRLNHLANLSPREEESLVDYAFDRGIRLFSGMVSSAKIGNLWNVTFFEPGTSIEASSIDLTDREYRQLISSVQKAVALEEAFRENWGVLAKRWIVSHVVLDKAKEIVPGP